jgi:hypothetical protein
MNEVVRIEGFNRGYTPNDRLVHVIDVVNRVDIHPKGNEEIKGKL